MRTALGRILDPRDPHHLAILTAATVGGAIAFARGFATGAGFQDASIDGFRMGVAVFFGWALAREFDPDHKISAFVAALLAGLAAIGLGLLRLDVMLWLLVLSRVLNRIVGIRPTTLDRLFIVALGTWISLAVHWVAGIVTAIALLLDSEMAPIRAHHRVFPVFALAGLVAASFIGWGVLSLQPVVSNLVLISAVLLLLSVPLVAASGSVRSKTDFRSHPILAARLRVTQLLAAGSGAGFALIFGSAGLLLLAPM